MARLLDAEKLISFRLIISITYMFLLERGHYRLLVALARHRSVTAAAQAVAITQSAATQRLKEAERRLGFAVTERRGRRLALTPAAERLAAAAVAAEATLDLAEHEALWIAGAAGPSLRLLLGVFDASGWIPPLAARLAAGNPPIALEVRRGEPETALARLAAGEADVMVAPFPRGHPPVLPPGLEHRPLFEDPLVAIMAPDDALASAASVTGAAVKGRDYITYGYVPEQGFEFDTVFRPGAGMPGRILRIESSTAIIDHVAAGRGVSVLSRWLVKDAVAAGRIVARPLEPTPVVRWALVARRRDRPDPVGDGIGRVLDCLRGTMGATADDADG